MAEVESAAQGIRVETSEVSAVVRELAVEIEAQRVDAAFERIVNELRRGARVKGFRPGKVPARVIRKMYGASLGEEIERALVRETLAEAVEQADLQPVVEPQIEAEAPVEGSVFRYKARIEVKPAIELPDLDAISGKRPAVQVGEEEVLTELETLRERQADWVEEAEDVAAAEGHQLTIDFVGTIDGVAFEGGSAEGVELELGSGRMIPGFEEQLVGARSGEKRNLEVGFPADYGNAELAGKPAVFATTVTAIKRKELPELDDDFAKDLGEEFERLDDVREKIREVLRSQRQHASDHALHRSLLDDLIARTSFEVPPSLVERQLDSQLRQFEDQMKGRVPEAALRARLAQMREEGRDEARRRVQEALLLEQIATQAALDASEEEVDARLDEMASGQGLDPELMRQFAESQGWRVAIRSELLDRKAMEHLIGRAKIADVEASEEA
ncbi:MAG: trigger factor [Spirochaetaceae bacterium]|nr:trigger factor [Myxococcales bacterium]MCB9726555.1 trigger factor [Spirochaetaceae bacterium]HPG27084.1 trigger factor [Myxococcota bacterium]